ncbi:SAM-dependent methyltransferase [Actinomadura graeca]|uniref:SAM-dependent methyltransferase n=1 Tax=Actinomadura graeca TaxID=2750812 RepID=A0ABX8QYP1_9ACTN|nr:SAM-dependent methyltransferase [Actinomadura graeca]QXJ23456.1 SAM-dependent methyltransferase [Actinomadura graeca]
MTHDPQGNAESPDLNTSVPHSARVWNYWLGGKDNYPADRAAGDHFIATFPSIVEIARHSRHLLTRVVRHLAQEEGVRQFLDIGTGLPTVNNTHEVAQRVAPDARIVYVDNDPLVLTHARALLTSTPEGRTAYVDADLCDPAEIVRHAAGTLDFGKPIALMLMGILGHIPDEQKPHTIVEQLVQELPSGSYLSIWDGVNLVTGEALDEAQEDYNEGGAIPYHLRSPEEIARFFEGLELLEPGVVSLSRWRPEPNAFGEAVEVDALCGVARKP